MKSGNSYLKLAILIAIIAVLINNVNSQQNLIRMKKGAPHVHLQYGVLSGTMKTSRNLKSYYAFMGVPYANPPRRFEPPSALNQTWKSVKPAHEYGSICSQLHMVSDDLIGSEDCLFSNIFIPMNPTIKTALPVMVFIHGGGFTVGGSDEAGPEYFMDHDVIIVTINYRLGALGFLSTEDDVVPGNNGLRDQMTALQWVQKNIEAFGGDPKRVTIFGLSAGSASVHHLVLSPLTKGLFQNAISLSGTAFDPWATLRNPSQTAKKLGNSLKCPARFSEELIQCLRNRDAKDILKHSKKLLKWNLDPLVLFGPTIEKTNIEEAIIPDTAENLIESGKFNKIPFILGITQDEGIGLQASPILFNEKLTKELNDEWNNIAPITFIYEELFRKKDLPEVSAKIRTFYFGDNSVGVNTRESLTNLYSDTYFVYGTHKTALAHARYGPTYLYLYSYKAEFTYPSLLGVKENLGATHGDDMHMYFKTKFLGPAIEKESPFYGFSENLVKLWVSFATDNKPTQIWGDVKEWEPLSRKQLANGKPLTWFVIDEKTSILKDPFPIRMQFWDDLFRNYGHESYLRDEL